MTVNVLRLCGEIFLKNVSAIKEWKKFHELFGEYEKVFVLNFEVL